MLRTYYRWVGKHTAAGSKMHLFVNLITLYFIKLTEPNWLQKTNLLQNNDDTQNNTQPQDIWLASAEITQRWTTPVYKPQHIST